MQPPAPVTAATTNTTAAAVSAAATTTTTAAAAPSAAAAAASAAGAVPAAPQHFHFGPEAETSGAAMMLKKSFSEFTHLPPPHKCAVKEISQRARKSPRFPFKQYFSLSLKAVKLCQVQDRDSHCNTMPVCLLALLKLWIMNFY